MEKYERYMEIGSKLGYKAAELDNWISKKIKEDEDREQKKIKENEDREQRLFDRETKRRADEALQKAEEALQKAEADDRETKRRADEALQKAEADERLKEIENIKLAQLQLSQGQVIEARPTSTKEDTIKIKYFNPKEEKIESYLMLFETIAQQNKIAKDKWATLLLSKVTGDAINVIGYIKNQDRTDYEIVKSHLLTHFGQTEDTYRRKFQDILLERTKDPRALIHEIHATLLNWLELAKIDTLNPQQILEMYVVNKVLTNASPKLFTFLKERKINNEEKLITALADYKDAHPNVEMDARQNIVAAMSNFKSKNTNVNTYQNRDRRRFHSTPNFNWRERRVCWHCQKVGHLMRNCRIYKNRVDREAQQRYYQGEQSRGRQQLINYLEEQERGRPERRYYVEQDRGRPGQIYNGDQDRGRPQQRQYQEDQQTRKKDIGNEGGIQNYVSMILDTQGRLKFYPAFVNGKRTLCLRDSGCTTIVVDEKLVDDSNYTEKMTTIKMANQKEITCKTAKISIDTPWVNGEVIATVIKNAICPLIIGNIPSIPDNSEQLFEQWLQKIEGQEGSTVCIATTRSECREPEIELTTSSTEEILETNEEITREKLIDMQRKDTSLDKIRERINNNQANYRGHLFYFVNDVLTRKFQNQKVICNQIVVPKELRDTVLRAAHDSPLAGHMSVRKTYQRVAQNFFWPNIRKDIKSHINKCKLCITKNPMHGKHKAPIQPTDKVGRPFEKIAIDIVGPMSHISSEGHKYILTIIDTATRWPEAIPLRNVTSETICTALLDIFTRYGFPDTILSDNGTQFTSQMTNAVTKLLDISQVYSTIYRPQANGMNERWNKTLKTMLAKATVDHPKSWNKFIPMVLFAYREITQDSTGFSPFELMFGANPRGPLSVFKERILGKEVIDEDSFNVVTKIRERIIYGVKNAQENAEKQSERQRNIKNKNRYLRSLEEDDQVYVGLPKNKGDTSWHGPYLVLKKINKVDYVVDMNGDAKVLHIDLLRKYDNKPESMMKVTEEMKLSEECSLNQETPEEAKTIREGEIVATVVQLDNDMSNRNIVPVKYEGQLRNLMKEFRDVITNEIGYTNKVQHTIETTQETNLKQKQYPIPYAYREAVKKELDHLIETNKIRRSNSDFSSPVVVVKKKSGQVRICCDFRELNKITKIDAEPIRDTRELLEEIGSDTIFTHFDLNRGFWQIGMEESSIPYTAFATDDGLFEWTVMPFGLVNSTATFSRFMREMLAGVQNTVHFVDDICIHTKDWKSHLAAVKEVLKRLRQYGVTIAPDKLTFAQSSIDFLGFRIGNGVIQPTNVNKDKILNIKVPKTQKEVKGILGLCNFYSTFIPKFADITAPLRSLITKEKKRIVWTEECQNALDQIKQVFQSEQILIAPDLSKEFILVTDASNIALGACLMQEVDDKLKPIQYLSRALTKCEMNYSTIEKECLAVVWALTKLQKYLLGRKFTLLTDHKPLMALNKKRIANSRINRWFLILLDYQFDIKSIKGRDNVVADFLSRQIDYDKVNESDSQLEHISQKF